MKHIESDHYGVEEGFNAVRRSTWWAIWNSRWTRPDSWAVLPEPAANISQCWSNNGLPTSTWICSKANRSLS